MLPAVLTSGASRHRKGRIEIHKLRWTDRQRASSQALHTYLFRLWAFANVGLAGLSYLFPQSTGDLQPELFQNVMQQ